MSSLESRADAQVALCQPKREDFDALREMFVRHAAHEGLAPPKLPSEEAMQTYLVEGERDVFCRLIKAGDELAGYVSCAPEFSTWSCAQYLHMDCLYLKETYRRQGIGAQVMQALQKIAAQNGYQEIQWQTPPENHDAIAFYDAMGAKVLDKKRFSL